MKFIRSRRIKTLSVKPGLRISPCLSCDFWLWLSPMMVPRLGIIENTEINGVSRLILLYRVDTFFQPSHEKHVGSAL